MDDSNYRITVLGAVGALATILAFIVGLLWVLTPSQVDRLGSYLDGQDAVIWTALVGIVPAVATFFAGLGKGQALGEKAGVAQGLAMSAAAIQGATTLPEAHALAQALAAQCRVP
jgi:hypothetical protein